MHYLIRKLTVMSQIWSVVVSSTCTKIGLLTENVIMFKAGKSETNIYSKMGTLLHFNIDSIRSKQNKAYKVV